jgi:hypothetical protein
MSKVDFYKRRCTECNLDFVSLELDIDGNCPKCHEPCMILWPKKDLPPNWPYDDPTFFISNTSGIPEFPGHHPAWSAKVSTEGRPFDPKTLYAAIDRLKEEPAYFSIDGRKVPETAFHHAYCHIHGIPHKHEAEE